MYSDLFEMFAVVQLLACNMHKFCFSVLTSFCSVKQRPLNNYPRVVLTKFFINLFAAIFKQLGVTQESINCAASFFLSSSRINAGLIQYIALQAP